MKDLPHTAYHWLGFGLGKGGQVRTFWNTMRAASSVVVGDRSAERTALKACASFRRVAISWTRRIEKHQFSFMFRS